MMPVLTYAGENLIAQQQQAGRTLIIDQMILANINGLDSSAVPDRGELMPSVSDIQVTQPITKDGLLNSNTVVYSAVFTSTQGTFDFNWMGLYSSEHDVLVAVAYVPTQTKMATVGASIGNVITKNFAIEFNGAADVTGINISAESWQIDQTARFLAVDKIQRDMAKSIYGQSTFLNDAFKIFYSDDKCFLKAGESVVEGIKQIENDDIEIVPGAFPKAVWLDVYQETTVAGVVNNVSVQLSDGDEIGNYSALGVDHFLVKIGTINSKTDIVDERQTITDSLEVYNQGNIPHASTDNAGISGLSSSTNSNSETESATPKAVKAVQDYFYEKTTKGFSTLDALLAEGLSVGQTAQVKGESSSFIIVASNFGEVGKGKIYACANGNRAKRVIDGQVENISELRLTEPKFYGQKLQLEGYSLSGHGGGPVFFDSNDTTSIDNGVDTFVTTLGARWKRPFTGQITLAEAGAIEGQDSSDALEKAMKSNRVVTGEGKSYLLTTGAVLDTGLVNSTLKDVHFTTNESFVASAQIYTYSDTGDHANYPMIFVPQANRPRFLNVSINGENMVLPDSSSSSLILFDRCLNVKMEEGDYKNNQGDNPTHQGGAVFLLDCIDVYLRKVNLAGIKGEGLHCRSHDVTVIDCTGDGSDSSLLGTQRLTFTDIESVGFTVRGGTYKNAANSAISANTIASVIDGVTVKDSGIGINIGHRTTYLRRTSGSKSKVINCEVDNCVLYGINNAYAGNVTIAHNTVSRVGLGTIDNNNAGIRATYWGYSADIVFNTVEDCLVGINANGFVSDADDTVHGEFKIIGNTIKNIQRYAMLAQGIANLHLKDNTCLEFDLDVDITRACIYLNSGSAVTCSWIVSGNILGQSDSIGAKGFEFLLEPGGSVFKLHDNIVHCSNGLLGSRKKVELEGNTFMDLEERLLADTVTDGVLDVGHAKYLLMSYEIATTIDTISQKLAQGTIMHIVASNNNTTLTDGVGNLYLASDFTMTTNDSITLLWSGGAFYELARSAN
jgi:hypothetical protein